MASTLTRRLAALALACAGGCGALALTVPAPAQADPTFTRITTPAGRPTFLVRASSLPITVSGQTSPDVTSVDLDCLVGSGADAQAEVLASAVPVVNGGFSATGTLANDASFTVCRLRALPQGVSPTDSLTAFAGPVLNVDTLKLTSDGTNTLDFRLTVGSGEGKASIGSAGKCGVAAIGTLAADLAPLRGSQGCVADLGGTAGFLRIDGFPALLPPEVLAFTNGTSPLTLSVHTHRSGQVTWTESAPLVHCSGTHAYPPPSPGACGALVGSGVTFHRAGTFDASGHQVRVRDSFTSNDGHRHRIPGLQYGVETTAPPTGEPGFAFPHHADGFQPSTAGETIVHVPPRAATLLVRSDRFAAEGDPQASTRAVTWSHRTSNVGFSPDDATVLALGFILPHVPRHGAVSLGFTDAEAVLTSTARALGQQAVAAAMPSPRITSPAKGAVIHGHRTVVKVAVSAGANGLPVSVGVNRHRAVLTSSSATRATYRVVLDEPLGTNTLTAVARDDGHNKRSTSITVRNK
jgi:hypothetical protein